jgi:hypothetical protein
MPCTTAKLEANRQNAKKSTGPRTKEGKARSSRNALKHGFCASGSSLAPLEDRKAYAAFTAAIIDSLRPATAIEEDLAHRIADLSWRLRRIPDAEAALLARDTMADLLSKCASDDDDDDEEEDQKHDEQDEAQQEQEHQRPQEDQEDDDDDDDDEIVPDSPDRHLAAAMAVPQNSYLTLQRYESSLDRARSRALKELRQLQKDRRDNAADTEDAPRRNEPTTPSLSSATSLAELQRPELRNEPTDESPSRPLRDFASSRLPQTSLRNEPTAPPESNIPNPNSQTQSPRLHVLKPSELRPIHPRDVATISGQHHGEQPAKGEPRQ